MKRTSDSVVAALLAPGNVLAVLAGAAAGAATGEVLPLLAAAGAALAYAGLVTLVPPFRRVVRGNLLAQQLAVPDPEPGLEALLGELSPSQRQHYQSLEGVKDDILTRYRQLPGGRVLAASSEGRLQALLGSFVRLVGTLNGYRRFLGAADREALVEELGQLEAELAAGQSERLREVKLRRVELLRKRVQRYAQAEESREVVSHQLASIEDVLRLTHEQSIAVRDPEGVGRQLEALTAEVTATEETVRELEQFLELTEEFTPAPALPAPPVRTR